MRAPVKRTVQLTPHPAVPSPAVRGIEVSVSRVEGKLTVTYRLDGDVDHLRVPLERPSYATDRLWEHTCFELFVALAGERAYHELNFAPYGASAVYAFQDYRQRLDSDLTAKMPGRQWKGASFGLIAEVDLAALDVRYVDAELVLGVSAVIEDVDGQLSYWALAHPQPKPDFHHRDAFTLVL
jgi:hypothetical protein